MNLKCECGGTFRRVHLESYDFSGYAGLPVELRGAPGLQCDKGGEIAMEGEVVSAALQILTQKILGLPRALSPDEAKFLRKRLQLSRKGLAEKMGTTCEAVAAWECGEEWRSCGDDLILRGVHRRPL